MQDERYDSLRIAESDYDDWIARIPLQEIVRGLPLRQLWNNDWNFQILDEDNEEHPAGLGDFAQMYKLITTTNERGFELLKPLLGGAAEILMGNYCSRPLWFFNVTRHVDRKDIKHLEDGDVFRITPVGLDILCGAAFKDAVEGSGLKGMKFRKVDRDDEFGMT